MGNAPCCARDEQKSDAWPQMEAAALSGPDRDKADWYGSARVVRVVDGDTAVLDLWMPRVFARPVRHTCRLYGVDAPELKGARQQERLHAVACKYAVEALLAGRAVPAHLVGLDVCKRFVVDMEGVAGTLLAHTPVRAYDARRKRTPCPAELMTERAADPWYAPHFRRAMLDGDPHRGESSPVDDA
jgi:endonuclease YncB( thermonuclease family)